MQSFLVNGFSIFLSYSIFGTALLSIMIGISSNDNNAVLVPLWLTWLYSFVSHTAQFILYVD